MDHKTGLDLVPKQEPLVLAPVTKVEPEPTPTHTPAELNSFIIDYAMGGVRTDDQLNASLAAFADDRLIIPQHNIDFTSKCYFLSILYVSEHVYLAKNY